MLFLFLPGKVTHCSAAAAAAAATLAQLQFDGMIARGDHLHHEDISGRNVILSK